ncbi:MAG: beta galactosidase jelly roll domain-containing protein [candidate division KSB1 bacterium]
MNSRCNRTLALLSLALTLTIYARPAQAQNLREALSLRGMWKFEIGDNLKFAEPSFDDSKWEEIRVPREWERQGYPGYDGYAWYRLHFAAPEEAKEFQMYVLLGQIDDVDEVYLNGHMIGYQGRFPPDYQTGYNIERRYTVPPGLLQAKGDNVLAVRVYDDELAGGIVHGEVGLFYAREQLELALDLSGKWKLKMDDDMRFSEPGCDESSWQQVAVPGIWDGYGNKDFNGTGWYRTRFRVMEKLLEERLVLVLGRIDDVEEVYLNGKLLGRTGTWSRRHSEPEFAGDDWLRMRAYFISPNLLVAGAENVLAVRVYDGMLHGGIWDGPVGLTTRKEYRMWSENRSRWGDVFEELFGR